MLSTACVDKDYDLGNIDTDNIAIGDEGSQFRIPLVKVLVLKDEIKNNGGNIEEIFREADIWFPSQLPDGKFVDLVKLQDKDDQTYVNTLLRTLREEMQASDAKLASGVDLVWDKYAAEFLLLLNLTAPDEQTFKTAFKTAYRNDASLRERLADEVSALARTYLTGSLGTPGTRCSSTARSPADCPFRCSSIRVFRPRRSRSRSESAQTRHRTTFPKRSFSPKTCGRSSRASRSGFP